MLMQNIINALLNMLLVSVPEEFIWSVLSLIFLKRFDLLDWRRWKYNLKQLMIPVLPTALMINILRYIIIVPKPIMTLINVVLINVLIIIMLKHNKRVEDKFLIIKSVLFNLLSLFLMTLIEYIYVPTMLFLIKKSINDINNDILLNFLLSLPTRILQIIVVIFILIKKDSQLYVKTIKYILYDKFIMITTLIFVGIILSIWVLLVNFFGDFNIIGQLSINQQLLTSVLLLIIPTIIISLLLYIIIYFFSKITRIQKSHQNMFDDDIE
jgi:hypothetical protein